jgi:hypothetical protein
MRRQPTETHQPTTSTELHELFRSGERPAFRPDPFILHAAAQGRLEVVDRYLAIRAELAAYFARGVR